MFYKSFHIALICCLLAALVGLFFVWQHIQYLNSIIDEQHKALTALNKEVEALRLKKP